MAQNRPHASSNDRYVLLSVKPQYAHPIVEGIKSIELRRRFPENLPAGTRCLIYASSPVQKIIGECEIELVIRSKINDLWKEFSIDSMISWEDFRSYFNGLEHGFAIKLTKYMRYKNPIPLAALGTQKILPPQSYRYLSKHDLAFTI